MLKENNCSSSPHIKLCGHGFCLNVKDNFYGYKCVCDAGWTSNLEISPMCDIDINECNSVHPSCSKAPLVECINTKGSFECGSCPQGYTGNGFYCIDVNECDVNNGDCSIAPKVDCINTIGSFHCDNCPEGFHGNGRRCLISASCPSSLCHVEALCLSLVQGAFCSCPFGFSGSGYGPDGCIKTFNSSCLSNPCLNGGNCVEKTNSYICQCHEGYDGNRCQTAIEPCQSNPCHNNDVCYTDFTKPLNLKCICSLKYAGQYC